MAGVITVELNAKISSLLQLTVMHGALIVDVQLFEPPYNAGLRRGDIIEEINGNKIDNPSQVFLYIRKKKIVNDTVTIMINRYGKYMMCI